MIGFQAGSECHLQTWLKTIWPILGGVGICFCFFIWGVVQLFLVWTNINLSQSEYCQETEEVIPSESSVVSQLLAVPWVTQRQLYHWKASGNMENDSGKVHPGTPCMTWHILTGQIPFSLAAVIVYITLEGTWRILFQELSETCEFYLLSGSCKGFIYFPSLKEPSSIKECLH